ncbi:MAG: hypothetical protein HC924_16330, partial [Synechococcaceae cyanobacterium SM2_3_2]|nr:hypothetical protein [Synechococcaceae cyanobacterium SM2_3_2]
MQRIQRVREHLSDTYCNDKRFTWFDKQASREVVRDSLGEYQVLPDNTMPYSKYIALDIECRDLDRYDNEIYGVGIYSLDWKQASWFTDKLALQRVIDSSLSVIGHNLKFDIQILWDCWAISIPRDKIIDTMVLSYIVNPEQSHGLKNLAANILGYHPSTWEQVKDNKDALKQYCLADCWMTASLYEHWLPTLTLKQQQLFDLECKLVWVLWQMELTGIRVDTEALLSASKELVEELNTLSSRFDFNLNSPEQLSNYLFIDKGLTPYKYGSKR